MARKNSEAAQLETVAQILEPVGALKGMSFSITGHLGRPRDEIVKLIETAGGEFHKQPGWGTKFLITNKDWNAGSTAKDGTSIKLEKARRSGTKIISEAKFLEMLAKGQQCGDGFDGGPTGTGS